MARKRFGQNFLVDEQYIENIIRAIDPQPTQAFVEIGPGKGVLTAALAAHGGPLLAIEIDRDLVALLQRRLPHVKCLSEDALRCDFGQLAQTLACTQFRLVGNLPYNISTPLLFRFIHYLAYIADSHIMVQREVGERLAAEPGSKAYGRLSIMAQLYWQVHGLFDVPSDAFEPAPKVVSRFLRLVNRPLRPQFELARLEVILRHAFGQRRKTIKNALGSLFTLAQLHSVGIDPQQRPEQLSVETYAQLSLLEVVFP